MIAYRTNVLVCYGTGCVSNESYWTREALANELVQRGLEKEILIAPTGCQGFCAQGPIAVVQPEGIFYRGLTQDKVPYLVQEHFLKGRPVTDFMYKTPSTETPVPKLNDIPFFSHQRLIALRNRGLINPENIDEYIGRDGYRAVARALLEMKSGEIIDLIKKSGLRGRGGAGFPTGVKWELTAKADDRVKYVVCNADEGDPGAFMDRSILEADPHSVIEGMTVGAKAVGAHKGFIYIRKEYPLALERLKLALDQAHYYGLLGKNILGSGFDFDIEVNRGAGAFVCGEETALLCALEGRSIEPRPRPPYPVQKGHLGRPTNINNVETWANIPPIISRGADWFSALGTETSKGTKVFSLVGKVKNTGLIEVPMGTTLKEIIFDIGGGVQNNKKFKAVQTGGPSGGCLPIDCLDMPIDYESLIEAGSMMGSGGMVVMDEDTCMVDIARYFLDFSQSESCGKCTPCREGTRRMCEILTRICKGEGVPEDIEELEVLSRTVKETSLCGLGQTAPNPVLSTLKHFREEYEQHIKYKRCPASVCRELTFVPCKSNCPVDTDIPAFMALIAKDRYPEAFDVISRTNPFPIVTSYVCHHPCEDRCRGADFNQPMSVKSLKRFTGDMAVEHGLDKVSKIKNRYREKVAVVGSGPAGLTAAHDLKRLGYPVTIFESSGFAGGMLRAAIPTFRLPDAILEVEIRRILKLGIDLRLGIRIGSSRSVDDLLAGEFKAVFLATGAHLSAGLSIPGSAGPGVIDGLEFLKDVRHGRKVELGERVVVIGGGNAAIDAARTAWRLGSEVTILYRRTQVEMPAMRTEITEGIKEGIKFKFLVAPTRVISSNGTMTGVECVRMELGSFDSSGRRRPEPMTGSEFVVEADNLIPAIGERPETDYLEGSGVGITEWRTIDVDPEVLTTAREGVFAGGDAVTGPSTIADSIAQGKLAARSIHQYLRGESIIRVYQPTRPGLRIDPLTLTDEEMERIFELERVKMPTLAVEDREKNFDQVELGLSGAMARDESRRCLRCDL